MALAALLAIARAAAADPADALATSDPQAVAAAVGAIEGSAAAPPELIYAAARACEDKLADPVRALALYERIRRAAPNAAVAIAADERAALLRDLVGRTGAAEARAFAALVANADALAPGDVIARGDALAAADWPGAPDAALWLADYSRRVGRYEAARARYLALGARVPRLAATCARDAAAAAVDARDWPTADALVRALPGAEPDDRLVRDELLRAIARGRRLERIPALAALALAVAALALIASLVEAAGRGGWKRPALAPPVEVWFAAPIAAVLVGVAATAQRLILPAVVRISLVGLAGAWLSGATLALLRARGRATRVRSLAQIAACAVAVIAVAYLALVRDGLLDLLVETVRFGPES